LGWRDGLVVIKLRTPEPFGNVQKPLKALLLKPTLAQFNHITLIHKARSLTDWTVFVCHGIILNPMKIRGVYNSYSYKLIKEVKNAFGLRS